MNNTLYIMEGQPSDGLMFTVSTDAHDKGMGKLTESVQIDQKVMSAVEAATIHIKVALEDLPFGKNPGDKAQEYHRIIAKAKKVFEEKMNRLDREYK